MDATISAGFSGRPYDLRMRVYTIENNVGGNYSRYHGSRYAYSRQGYGSYAYDNFGCDSWIAGYHAGGAYSLPFGPGSADFTGKTIGLGEYDTGGVGHAPDGSLSFTARIRMLNASVFGSADTGDVWLGADHLPRPPSAPTMLGIDEVTPTSMRVRFSGNWDGGSPITAWKLEYDDDPNFGSSVIINSSGTSTVSGLTPGTPYTFRAWGHNAYWQGYKSSTLTQTTLPATAPGISIVPTLSGTGARVTLTPPGSASGVTKYRLERRLSGTTTYTVVEGTSPVFDIVGLTPGSIYEWRASAFFGTYQSPISTVIPVAQPNPNTNPGDYYDGGTAPRSDTTFEWNAAAGSSTSRAVGLGVDGWQTNSPTGAVVLYQITGGYLSSKAARMLMTVDATVAGVAAGMAANETDAAAVTEGGMYFGSIRVRPSRAQVLSARLTYYDEDWNALDIAISNPVLISDTTNFSRLYANSTAPASAAWAITEAVDQTGTGVDWVAWKGGEFMDLDRAQVTLGGLYDEFDGSTADELGFNFDWLDDPNASVSTKTPVPVELFDPLADPDCDPLPAPPLPPMVLSDCIVEVGTWRRYVVQIGENEVYQHGSTLATLYLRTDASDERQVRIRWYPNPDGLPPDGLDLDAWEAEQILTYIPPNTVITLDGVTRRAWAGVNGAAPRSADHLLFGTDGVPATWPVLECGIGYVITLDVPTEAPAGNLTTTVALTPVF
jgi:hypothetical protein